MMKFYKIKLKPKSFWRTPLNSDTLAGYMMWLLKLNSDSFDFIYERFINGKTPFVFSNGFPGDTITMPCHIKKYAQNLSQRSRNLRILANLEYLSLDLLDSIQNTINIEKTIDSLDVNLGEIPNFDISYHDTIQVDRQDTLSNFNHSSIIERIHLVNVDHITIYAAFETDEIAEIIKRNFEIMEYHGFGRGSSRGFGVFKLEDFSREKALFINDSQKQGRIALSHFCPADGQKIPNCFEYYLKEGKIGEKAFGLDDESFDKKAIMMIKSGAFFQDYDRHTIGCIKENIAADRGVIQLGHSVLLPTKSFE
ncbi:MAG: type III-A CRISPR-associated RAMP protein Csm4 [Candidatus Zixiibacteriota bacterium]